MLRTPSDLKHPPAALSIVVPVHNGGDSFKHCLASLKKIALASVEIIVVADGDSDDSWRWAEGVNVRVIRLPRSRGPARARNVGATVATADILLFVDADVTVPPDVPEKIVAAFAKNPEMAALIGSYDDEPGCPQFLSQYKNLFHHYTHQQASNTASTFWGACGAIRREAFWAVDGFDPSYRRPCIEDIDLGYRLRQAGYQIHLYKDIQVKHLKTWTPSSLLKAEIFYRALPWTALLMRLKESDPQTYQQFSQDLNLSAASRLSAVLVLGLLISLMMAMFFPMATILSMAIICGLLHLNFSVYQFFWRKRGGYFALQALLWHWLYYLYSSLCFGAGALRHLLSKPWLRLGPLVTFSD